MLVVVAGRVVGPAAVAAATVATSPGGVSRTLVVTGILEATGAVVVGAVVVGSDDEGRAVSAAESIDRARTERVVAERRVCVVARPVRPPADTAFSLVKAPRGQNRRGTDSGR